MDDAILKELIKVTADNPALESIYWQLRGYDMVGLDQDAPHAPNVVDLELRAN